MKTNLWTQKLADLIVQADVTGASESVRRKATSTIVDTVGCIVAGLPSEVGRAVAAYTQIPPSADASTLWGTGGRNPGREQLALIGGTAGAALDYDDVSSNGHPSSIIVATALAMAAEQPTSGADLLDSYLIGYEVAARLGDAVHLPHSRHGWHTTSTVGYFSATATACRMMALDRVTTRHALGIAASMAAGIGRNFGTMTKPLHSGLAARGGVAAAGLAASGVTSAPDSLEGPRGFLAVYGLGQSEPEQLDRFGQPWAMAELSPSLKKYPACYVTHRGIDAVLRLQDEHDLQRDDIERIVVRAPTKSTGTLAYKVPATGLEAKFSTHYTTAAAFLDRRMTMASFHEEMVTRPAIRELISIVDVAEDPRCRPEDPTAERSTPIAGGFWEVTIDTVDGRSLQAVSDEPPGAPRRPLSWSDIRAKFLDCATASGCPEEAAGCAVDQLCHLPSVADVRQIMDLLAGGPVQGVRYA